MKLYVKNMVCNRCKLAVKEALKNLELTYVIVELGEVEILETISQEQRMLIKAALLESGLDLMDDKKSILIEKIKNVITKLIHYTEQEPKYNFSAFLSSRLNYDYTYLANLFSEAEGITIEQYIIAHKIERVKELLMYNELSLTEISFKMHYSSVAHLANQFKKVTGYTTSYFKQMQHKRLIPLEML
jgi:AraC-like DNA-binding protein